MSPLEAFAYAHAAGLGALYLFAMLAGRWRLRRSPVQGEVGPMTVIRPLKGVDDGLEENLRSVIAADPGGRVETLFAIETQADPAFPVASKVAAEAPGRARVVLTGPAGDRMGKAHNMIEAVKRASNEFVVFSDSDAAIDREVLVETSRAFADGADAVAGLPDATAARSPGDVIVCVCFNHFFDPLGTLAHVFGAGTFFSGTWMALRKDALARVGGLERFERQAADDFSLADALRRAKARVALLPRMVRLNERGGTLGEAVRHILKWARIVRWTVAPAFALLPLATPLPLAVISLGALAAGDPRPAQFWAFIACARAACARLLDTRTAASRFPVWAYAALPLLDLAFLGIWLAAWIGNTIAWRGRRYRIRAGGRLDPLAS